MHAHFEQVEWGPVYLAAGVTTVRDVGNEFDFITAVRDAIKARSRAGPADVARRTLLMETALRRSASFARTTRKKRARS